MDNDPQEDNNTNFSPNQQEKLGYTSPKKYHIIYKTTNIINNKIYIGYHGTNEIEDGYLGSGYDLKQAFKKYGKSNFQREVLFIFDNPIEAYKKEREIVDEAFVARKDTYNLTVGGLRDGQKRLASHGDYKKIVNTSNGLVYPNLTEAKKALNTNYIVRECGNPNSIVEFEDPKEQKKAELVYQNFLKNKEVLAESCSKRFKGVPLSEERKKKHSESQKGKKRLNPQNKDPEKIRKTAEKHRGMKRSEEAKKRMSESAKGKIISEEAKKKISEFNKGKIISEETRKKMSESNKGKPSKGRKISNEDVIKIREDYKNRVDINLINDNGKQLQYKSGFCKIYAQKYQVSSSTIRSLIDNKSYMEIIID